VNKRDYREETAFNAAEERLLVWSSGKLGLSKSATLRLALHRLGDDLLRKEKLSETGLITDLITYES